MPPLADLSSSSHHCASSVMGATTSVAVGASARSFFVEEPAPMRDDLESPPVVPMRACVAPGLVTGRRARFFGGGEEEEGEACGS